MFNTEIENDNLDTSFMSTKTQVYVNQDTSLSLINGRVEKGFESLHCYLGTSYFISFKI